MPHFSKIGTVSPRSYAGGKNGKCGYLNGASGSKKNILRKEFLGFPVLFYRIYITTLLSIITTFLRKEMGFEKLSHLSNIIPSVKGRYKI